MGVSSFSAGQDLWIRRLGNLRNTIRQEMIRRQLLEHVAAPMSVLDVGCGQGTQAIALAQLGCRVAGVEPSPELRELAAADADAAGVDIELLAGTIGDLTDVLGDRSFDVVCAHGLLMYLDDRAGSVAELAQRLRPDGRLSVTVRNGHALAMRPGLRREWAAAVEALEGDNYVNELGVTARADRLEDVVADLTSCNLELVSWYGVRVFNDAVGSDLDIPGDEDVAMLLDAEYQAGRRDPYRWLGSQIHFIARPAGHDGATGASEVLDET